jgi:hypothetical protein
MFFDKAKIYVKGVTAETVRCHAQGEVCTGRRALGR